MACKRSGQKFLASTQTRADIKLREPFAWIELRLLGLARHRDVLANLETARHGIPCFTWNHR